MPGKRSLAMSRELGNGQDKPFVSYKSVTSVRQGRAGNLADPRCQQLRRRFHRCSLRLGLHGQGMGPYPAHRGSLAGIVADLQAGIEFPVLRASQDVSPAHVQYRGCRLGNSGLFDEPWYGEGFPKSMDLGNGYGTALKPAYEPIILAMKPCDGSFARNATESGVAGLNIDTL